MIFQAISRVLPPTAQGAASKVFEKILTTLSVKVSGMFILGPRMRPAILRIFRIDIGRDVGIGFGVTFLKRDRIHIGSGSYVGPQCYFENHAEVRLEENVWVAAGTRFAAATHGVGTAEKRAGQFESRPITVGRGSWIGAACTILPGVTIGAGCIIAAGSVVINDCEPDGLYAGVPATRKRDLDKDMSGAHPTNPLSK